MRPLQKTNRVVRSVTTSDDPVIRHASAPALSGRVKLMPCQHHALQQPCNILQSSIADWVLCSSLKFTASEPPVQTLKP